MSTPLESSRHFYTVGYEGRSVGELMALLVSRKVKVLVDVRERALSRKKGFSKTALRHEAENVGIDYVHIRELGSPRELRHRLKEDGDYDRFFRDYSRYLEGQESRLLDLASLLGRESCCLMCFEREPTRCHRSRVADFLAQQHNHGLRPVHI